MKLFDTATKTYRAFEPSQTVSIYVCGITPYDSAHLGHIFTFMTYDLLQRRLEDKGHTVRMVRNITDVDEPIYAKAKELGIDYRDLAKQESDHFHSVLNQLNFRPTYAEPRASEYIDQMAAAVKKMVDTGFGYSVDDDIYFDVSKFPEYTKFSDFNDRLILGLAKARGGDPERAGKRNPLDFMLWKAVADPNDPAQWDSVVGRGRPGWHIECSVMASELLNVPFDLHGGGADLIFPHHSSEIAQSHALGQTELAKHWLHVFPMLHDGEKMSKSLGNLVFAKDLLLEHESSVIRLALMHYHHRIGGEWQDELLHEATDLLAKFHVAAGKCDVDCATALLDEMRVALDDDINTLEVIDALQRFVANAEHCTHNNPAPEVIQQVLQLIGLE
jgi:L-cysteine:1D-myo-inositol 2-amino-2-deoxy-alpha-D-glucopyranoside ligase